MRRPDRQEFAKKDEEQRAERRPEKAAHAADHHHGHKLARERHGERLCRGEAVIEHRQRAGNCHNGGGQHEADQLVAVGRIAEETRALLVLADCYQDGAGWRAVKAPEHVANGHPDRRNCPIVDAIGFEIEAEYVRSRDAAQAAFTARELGPAVADGE